MTREEEFRIRQEVQERLIEYWWDVDRDGAARAPEFYTDDCVYLMCGHRMEGPAAVKSYYDFRASRGARLVRHVATNLMVRVVSPDFARLDGILSVYAADGVPVLPSAPPIMVADTHCEFVPGRDGQWRFRRHEISALFTGGVPVLAPPRQA